jgi:hypothetical protein
VLIRLILHRRTAGATFHRGGDGAIAAAAVR